jgi:mucin-19
MHELPKTKKYYSIKDAAEYLNVSTKTLRRWEDRDVIVPHRTKGGHRRYNFAKLEEFKNQKGKKRIRAKESYYPASKLIAPQIKIDKKVEPINANEIKYEPIKPSEFPILYQSVFDKTQKRAFNFFLIFSIFTLASFAFLRSSLYKKITITNKVAQYVSDKASNVGFLALKTDKTEPVTEDSNVLALTSTSLSAQTFNVYVPTNLENQVTISGDTTIESDLAVNGGDLTSSADVFNLFNTTPTTLNIGGAATTVSIGATTGTTTVNNDLAVLGDLNLTSLTVGDDTVTDLTGTGLQVTAGALESTLGTSIESSEITDGTITEVDLFITNTATDNYVLTYDSASGGFSWAADAAGSGSLFTDGGTYAYLTTTTDDLVLGGTTVATADIFFGNTGEAIFNEQGLDSDFRIEGDTDPELFFADAGNDTITVGSSTSLAKLGIDGDFDEIQFLVQGNSTQTSNLAVFEQSDGTDILTLSNSGALALFDGGLLDLSAIAHNDTAAQGLKLPQSTSLTNMTGVGKGYLAYDTDDDYLAVFDGTTWSQIATGGGIGGGGSAGQVTFWSTGTNITGNSIFYWDNTNELLGIGTGTPTSQLHVEGSYSTNPLVLLNETGGQIIFEAQASGTPVARITNAGNILLTGTLNTVSGNLTIDSAGGTTTISDIVNLGSATTGINVTAAGLISDIDGNLILDDTVDIGSGTTGIRVTTAGAISDIDGNISLIDNTDITGNLDVSGTLTTGTGNAFQVDASGNVTTTGTITANTTDTINTIDISSTGALSDIESVTLTAAGNSWTSGGALTISGDLAVNGGDITTSATILNIDVANTGDIIFRDGTNNLFSISDEGTYGIIALTTAGSQPGTCTEGQIYADDNGNLYYCESTNTWVDLTLGDGAITGTGNSGEVSFWNGSSTQTGDATFFWDDANNLLGIGTGSPAHKLEVTGTYGGNALVALNETGSNDIFTASQGGTPKLTITNAGNIQFHQAGTITTTTGNLTLDTTGGSIVANDNFDAIAGLDVTNNNLTVGGANFSVAPATGNITTVGTLTLPNSNILTGVASYVRLSQGLSVGGADTYYFNSSGNLNANQGTFAGTLDANGIVTLGDGGDAITLSGTTVNITSNSATNDIILTSADDIQFDDLQLGSAVTLTDVDSSLPNSNTGIVDAINDAWNAAIGGGGGVWTLDTNTIYPTTLGNRVGIGTTTAGDIISKLYITSGASQLTGKALAILVQTESQDIFTASAGATTRLTLTNAGNLQTGDLTLGLNDTSATITTADNENLTLDPAGTGDIYFHGSTYQLSDTGDLTLGGRITFENAAFIQNEVNGTLLFNEPTAQFVASTSLDVDSPLIDLDTQATDIEIIGNNSSALTISDGSNNYIAINTTTGTEVLTLGTAGTLNIDIAAIDLSSQATTVDLINSNASALSFESGLLRLDTANTSVEVTGTTNLGDGGSTNYAQFSSTGDLTFAGSADTITGPGSLFTITNTGANIALTTVASGDINITSAGEINFNDATTGTIPFAADDTTLNTPTVAIVDAINEAWAAALGGGGGLWTLTQNAIHPGNPYTGVVDLLLGSNATESAKFAFKNVNSGIPTASISAGVAGALYITADGTIATTAQQTLTLGDANTGNIVIDPDGGSGLLTLTGDFNFNGETFSDLTGNGLANSSGLLTIDLTSVADGLSSTTNSSSGLEVLTSGLTLIQGCSTGQILKWDETNDYWYCAADEGAGAGTSKWTEQNNLLYPNNGSSLSVAVGTVTEADMHGLFTVTGNRTGRALAIFNDTGTDQNILTASASGTTVLNLDRSGNLYADGIFSFGDSTPDGNAYNTIGTGDATVGAISNNQDLFISGDLQVAGTIYQGTNQVCDSSGAGCPAGSTVFWDETDNAIHPSGAYAGVADVLIGSTATESAEFAFINVDSGVPTASIAAVTAGTGALFITADGTISTTQMQPLTIGGSDTGSITLDAGAGQIILSDNTNLGANTLFGTTAVIDFTDFDVTADGLITLSPDEGGTGITISPSAGLTTGLDVSNANITNAISIGDNTILGGAGVIDFNEFDVDGDTGSVTINDDGNLGQLSVEGTILDIDSLTFVGAGSVLSTGANALTLDSGTTGTINLGTGNNAKTLNIGTGTAGNTINIGTDNSTADDINIGSALDATSITGDDWSVTDAGIASFEQLNVNNLRLDGNILSSTSGDVDIEPFSASNLDVNLAGGGEFQIDGGLTDFGSGTYTFADGDNDVGIAGDLEVLGTIYDSSGNPITGLWTRSAGVLSPLTDGDVIAATSGAQRVATFTSTSTVDALRAGGSSDYVTITSTGDLIFTGTNANQITGPSTDTFTITNAGTTTISATGGGNDLLLAAGNEIDLNAAGPIDINAGANLDIDITGTFDVLSTGAFSIDGTGASNVSATTGGLTLSTITSGDLILTSAGAVDINSAGAVTIDSGGSGDIALTSSDEIFFDDERTSAIPFSLVDTQLNASLGQAIIDAINDAYDAAIGGGGGVWTLDNNTIYPATLGNRVGIGTTDDTEIESKLFITSGASQLTGKSLLILDQFESEDIFTASAGGTSRLTLLNNGNLQFHQGSSITTTTGNLTLNPSGTIELVDNTNVTGNLDVSGTLTSGTGNAFQIDATGNISTSGTTGITFTGNDADILFSGTGTHSISASSGTLQLGAVQLGGTVDGNSQIVNDLGTLTFGTGNVNITSNQIGLTTDTDLLSLASGVLTVNGDIRIPNSGGATLEVGGGQTGVGYNSFAIAGDAPDEAAITAANDVYIGGDLEIDGTLYSNSVAGSYTQGSVIFAGASGVLSEDNDNFFWNDTANTLGIGTNSQTAKLDVRTSASNLTGKSALILVQNEAQDIFTASDGATTRLRLAENGNLFITGELNTVSGNLSIDSAGGTTTVDDTFIVTGTSDLQNTIFNSTANNSGRVVIDDETAIGSNSTGLLVTTAGVLSDIDGNLVLLPASGFSVDLGSATTGIRINEAGQILDIDGSSVVINDDLDILGGDITSAATTNLLNTGTTTINFGGSATAINIGDSTTGVTIDIGGVDSSAGDTIRIATEGTIADTITIGNSNAGTILALTGGNDWSIAANGAVIFNDAGNDADFRVEGTSDANLLFVDASTNRIGIGTNAPAFDLDIRDTASVSSYLGFGRQLNSSLPTCDTTTEGIIYYDGPNAKHYYCNGTVWNSIAAGGTTEWTLTSGVVHPNAATTDVAVGGTTLTGSIFGIDESAGNFYFGYDNSANPTFLFEATDGDAGEFGFNTNDSFYISNANFGIGDTSPLSLFTVGSGDLFQIDSSGIIQSIDGVAHVIDDVSGDLRLDSAGGNVIIADGDTLDIYGGIIGLNTDTNANDQIRVTSGSQATASLYWGNDLLCDPSLTDCGWQTSASNSDLWIRSANALYSTEYWSDDLLLGGNSTASAAFAFTGVSDTTRTATISGNLALSVPTGSAPATTLDILNGGTFNLRTSVGGNAGLATRLTLDNAGNLLPGTNDAYNLGSDSLRFADLYLGPSTLHIGSSGDESQITYTTATDLLSFQNSADSTTGFQFLDADGGTPILNIDTTNERVGIGTVSPSQELTLNGDLLIEGSQRRILGDFSTATSGDRKERLWFQTSTTNGNTIMGAIPNGSSTTSQFILASNSNPDLANATFVLSNTGVLNTISSARFGGATYSPLTINVGDAGEIMRFNNDGTAGIGTTTPDAKLEINHATGDNLRLTYNDSDGSAQDYTDLTLDSGGNLTIAPTTDGGTTPGTVNITGTLDVSAGINAGTANAFQVDANGLLTIGAAGSTAINLTRTSAGQWIGFNDGTDVWGLYNTAGSPEGVLAGNIGALSMDTTNGTLYVKTTDSPSSTGWVNLATGTSSVWTHIDHAVYPNEYWVDDLLIGGNSTASATFQVFATTGDVVTDGDLTVSGGDIVGAATTNLLNTTSTTINFGSAATTLNIADAAITGTIDIGGVTADGATTVNIATNATSADDLNIGNSNASTTVDITGGDDWSITGAGVATFTNVVVDNLDLNLNTLSSTTGDLILSPVSASNLDLNLAGGGEFQIDGGLTDFGSGTYTFADGDNDVGIAGDLEVLGTLYVGSTPISADSLWANTLNVYHPAGAYAGVADLVLGGTSTASAKFAFINVNSGDPTATISGNLALTVPTGSLPSTTLDIFNGGTFNLRTSVGGNSGLSTAFFVDNAGNVGFGTENPERELEIEAVAADLLIDSTGGTATLLLDAATNFDSRIVFQENGSNLWFLRVDSDDSQSLEIADGANEFLKITDQGTAADFAFNTNDLFIDDDNQIGMGTANPDRNLHILGGETPGIHLQTSHTASASNPYITFRNNANQTIGQITTEATAFAAHGEGTMILDYNASLGGIFAIRNVVASASEADHVFYIDGTGRIAIGGETSPDALLHVDSTNRATFGKAAFILNHDENQDIFTASASGVTVMRLTNSGDLYADGAFSFGDTTPDGNAYNTIGTGDASHTAAGEITDAFDLYITDDLEVDGDTWLDGNLYVGGTQISADSLWANTLNVYHPAGAYAGVADLAIGGTATGSASFHVIASGANAGDVSLAGDLTVSGGDIIGAATTNIANAATTLNLGSTNIARAVNIGTGTGVDTINIGTGATGADVISIGSANAGNLTLDSASTIDLSAAGTGTIGLNTVNGVITFDTSTGGNAINLTAGTGAVTVTGSADGTTALGITAGDLVLTDGSFNLVAGDFDVSLDPDDNASLTKTGAAATSGEGFEINFNAGAGDGSDVYRALVLDIASANHAASTDEVIAIDIDALAGADTEGVETALRIGSGWDFDIALDDTSPFITIGDGGTLTFSDNAATPNNLIQISDAGSVGNLFVTGGISTFDTTVTDGTGEFNEICLGNGTNCISSWGSAGINYWGHVAHAVYPSEFWADDLIIGGNSTASATFQVFATTGDVVTDGDLTVSGGDIVGAATTNLLNTTSTTINFGSAATTLNIADAAITGTIDIGGVTADGATTVNIATNATSADDLNIGNSNASTTVDITGGDDWSITGAGVATFTNVVVDNLDLNLNTLSSTTGDLILSPVSASNLDLNLAGGGEFQIDGGLTDFGSGTYTFADGDNDVGIAGDLEVLGTLYVGSTPISADSLWANTLNVYHPAGAYAGVADLAIGGTATGSASFHVNATSGLLTLINAATIDNSVNGTLALTEPTIQLVGSTAVDIDSPSINLATQATDIEIANATANALTISESTNNYLNITTNDTESVTLDLPVAGATSTTGNLFTSNVAKTINIGTGTAADAINIGTGGTSADTLTFGNTGVATTFTFNSGATTTNPMTFDFDTLTSGTGVDLSLDAIDSGTGLLIDNAGNSLTTGTLLQVQSTANTLTTAGDAFLGYFDWTPGSATTATGDLFAINIGPNGDATNLFHVTDNGSTLFRVSETQIESAVPHAFTAAGDVSFSFDAIFDNQTASKIESYGPFTILAGESFENNDLTFSNYNLGSFVFTNDDSGDIVTIDGNGTTTITNTTGQLSGKAALIVDQDESEDILTASAAGTTRLTLNNDGDLLPGTNDAQDLGSNTLRWQDLYTGPGTIHVGTSTSDEGQITYNTSTDNFILTNVVGDISLQPGNDTDDYLYFNTASNLPGLFWETGMSTNDAGFRISASDDTGQLQYRDQNSASWVSFDDFQLSANNNDLWQTGTNGIAPYQIPLDTYFGGTATASAHARIAGLETADGNILSILSDGITTGNVATISGTAVTTGNLLGLHANNLTSGSLLNVETHTIDATGITDGMLGYFNWSPGSTTTKTGDLVRINIGSNGNVTNLFNVTDNGSSLFRVSETQIESAVPHVFSAAGDVSVAYDLVFTNQTASMIESYGPFTIRVGESFENNNLRFETYGAGDVIFATGSGTAKVMINSEGSVGIGDTTSINNTNIPYGSLVIGNGILCVDDGGDNCDDSVRTSGYIHAAQTTVQGLDVAEKYPSNQNLVPGEVVTTTPNQDYFIERSSSSYQGSVIGIVSTKPGVLLGGFAYNAYPQEILHNIALSGRVPVKVSTENGPIAIGDYLTTSSIPGVAMKATQAGPTVAKALSSYNNPDQNAVGTAMGFVNISWYDPSLNIANVDPEDVLILVDTSDPLGETFTVTDASGNTITKTEALASLVVGNIRAGFAEVQKLVAPKIVSPRIETEVISPIAGGDIIIDLKQGTNEGSEPSSFGKLLIKGQNGDTVASIDEAGNAEFSGQVTSDTLQVTGDATVSGDLNADKVEANDIVAGKIYADQIVARTGSFGDLLSQSIAEITREEIENLLAEAEVDQGLLAQAGSWDTSASTSSAVLDEAILNNLFVTDTIATTSLSVSDSIVVGNDLVLSSTDSSGVQQFNSISTLNYPLLIQATGAQPVEIMAGLVKIDTSGNVDIAGSLAVGGDLNVDGQISGSQLTLQGTVPGSSGFGKLLALYDEQGAEVAGITASGSATFASVTSDQFAVKEDPAATSSATFAGLIFDSNASAGVAKVPSGSREIVIRNPQVKSGSLVFVTPTSSTDSILYIKDQVDGEITVGFDTVAQTDVTFNWWIVELVSSSEIRTP